MPAGQLLKKSLRIFRKIGILFVLSALFFFLFYRISKSYTVKEVEIVGISKKQTLKGLGSLENKNIFLLSLSQLEEVIFNNNPFIEDVKISKEYPNKIRIYIKSYRPIAMLKVSNGYFSLSKNGRIISKDKENNGSLPLISYYQKLDYYSNNVGAWIDYEDIQLSLQFLTYLEDLGLPISSIDINGLNMIGFNLDKRKIMVTTEKSREIQEYELGEMLKQFKVKGQDFKSIDLRFDKPVVVF